MVFDDNWKFEKCTLNKNLKWENTIQNFTLKTHVKAQEPREIMVKVAPFQILDVNCSMQCRKPANLEITGHIAFVILNINTDVFEYRENCLKLKT